LEAAAEAELGGVEHHQLFVREEEEDKAARSLCMNQILIPFLIQLQSMLELEELEA
jgi:hypothetical protein